MNLHKASSSIHVQSQHFNLQDNDLIKIGINKPYYIDKLVSIVFTANALPASCAIHIDHTQPPTE